MNSDDASTHQRRSGDSPLQALIPGAYERDTLTHRQAGSTSYQGSLSRPSVPQIVRAVVALALVDERQALRIELVKPLVPCDRTKTS